MDQRDYFRADRGWNVVGGWCVVRYRFGGSPHFEPGAITVKQKQTIATVRVP
jgi:hypothetical protein